MPLQPPRHIVTKKRCFKNLLAFRQVGKKGIVPLKQIGNYWFYLGKEIKKYYKPSCLSDFVAKRVPYPRKNEWRGEDSNLRRLSRQIYSLLPLTAREPLRIHPWSQRRESNPRPTDYKSVALPAELRWHEKSLISEYIH